MYCQNCGAQFEGSFCPNCGAPRGAVQNFSQGNGPQGAPVPTPAEHRPLTGRWWFWVLLIGTMAVVATLLFQRMDPRTQQNVEVAAEPTQHVAEAEEPEPAVQAEVLPVAAATEQPTEEPTFQQTDVTLEETVLLDQDGIRVVATGLVEEEWLGPEVSVLIENNSNKPVIIQASYAAINGAMVYPILSSEVAAGKKANETISFYQSDLDIAGITRIQTIELVLLVLDNESYETLITSQPIVLQTSAPKEPQVFDDSGFILVDQDGFRLVVIGISEEENYFGKDVMVFIENNTGRDIMTQLRNVSLNGYMIEPLFSCTVVDGKVAYSEVTFMQEDLEANGITAFEALECSVLVFDAVTWDDIFESDVKTVNFPF